MGKLVVMGAQLQCTMGLAPGTLMVLPVNKVNGSNVPAANIQDSKPMVNILPFGMCQSPANPMVAAATAAAFGVLTPMPCIPMTTAPWTPGATKTMIGNQPALTDSCTCMCNWAGTISVTSAGQTKIDAS
jgi:hypothetical protein